eukprot:766073-Hanusia_phi.AAC.1
MPCRVHCRCSASSAIIRRRAWGSASPYAAAPAAALAAASAPSPAPALAAAPAAALAAALAAAPSAALAAAAAPPPPPPAPAPAPPPPPAPRYHLFVQPEALFSWPMDDDCRGSSEFDLKLLIEFSLESPTPSKQRRSGVWRMS